MNVRNRLTMVVMGLVASMAAACDGDLAGDTGSAVAATLAGERCEGDETLARVKSVTPGSQTAPHNLVAWASGQHATISDDGRTLTVSASTADLDVIGPKGPRPGTVWDCRCGAGDDGCYWTQVDMYAVCSGSCGGQACDAKLINWPRGGGTIPQTETASF